MRRCIIALLLLSACEEQRHTVRVALYSQEQSEANMDSAYADLVREAGEILNLDVEFTESRWGALTLDLIELDIEAAAQLYYHGRTLDSIGCDRSAWVIPLDPQRVAHEMGHMMGLRNHQPSGENNLMQDTADPKARDLHVWQQHIVEANALRLWRC